jgi:hypothetical protein
MRLLNSSSASSKQAGIVIGGEKMPYPSMMSFRGDNKDKYARDSGGQKVNE